MTARTTRRKQRRHTPKILRVQTAADGFLVIECACPQVISGDHDTAVIEIHHLRACPVLHRLRRGAA